MAGGAPTKRMWGATEFLKRPWPRYVIAVAVIALTYLLRYAAGAVVSQTTPLALFLVPTLGCAFFLGLGPAFVALALTITIGLRDAAPAGLSSPETAYLITYVVVVSIAILFAGMTRSARAKAAQMQALAEGEAETARQFAEELDLLIEGATDYAIFMVDARGCITLWNEGARRIFGWRDDEVIGRHVDMFYAPEEVETDRPNLNLAAAVGEGSVASQVWQVRKDGSEFLADLTVTTLRGADAQHRGFACVLRDVTDRYASERAVERRERHLRSILETVPDAMIVVDAEGCIVAFSATAQRMFGYGEGELMGRSARLLLEPKSRDQNILALRSGHKQAGVAGVGQILAGVRKNGESFPMETMVGEAVSGGEQLFTVFIRDLTEKRGAEAQIQKLQAELIHVSRLSAMGTMASTLAHELNQPLTAIANYAEAAGSMLGSTDEEDIEALKEIFTELSGQSIRAGRIVRRLREFIARGEVEKRVEDLPGLVAEASGLALVGAREKGVAVQIDLDPDASPVLVDRVQIQQVLINLIRNAVEAMEASEVRKLMVQSCPEGDDMVRITVADTGPGIAPDVASQLFHAFVTSKESGMGLGLSICRTIVEAHGGRIQAQPRDGGGTIFSFTLVKATSEDM